MRETIKTIVIYGVAILILVLASYSYNTIRRDKLERTFEKTLYNYFKENNIHIAQYDFNIENVEIVCVGNKAYLVEFALMFPNDLEGSFDRLGATIYKENDNDEWIVRGFGEGFTTEEIDKFNFRCHRK